MPVIIAYLWGTNQRLSVPLRDRVWLSMPL